MREARRCNIPAMKCESSRKLEFGSMSRGYFHVDCMMAPVADDDTQI